MKSKEKESSEDFMQGLPPAANLYQNISLLEKYYLFYTIKHATVKQLY